MADSRLNVTVNPSGAISGAQKAAKALQALGNQAEKTEAQLNKIGSKTIKPKVNSRALFDLRKTAESVAKSLTAISKITIKPKVNSKALKDLRKTAQSVKTSLDAINRGSVNPKAGTGSLNNLRNAATKVRNELKEINKIKVTPNAAAGTASVSGLTGTVAALNTALASVTKSATAMGASIARSSATSATALGRVTASAKTAAVAIGRVGTTAGLSSAGVVASNAATGLNIFGRGAGKASTKAATFTKILKTAAKAVRNLGVATGVLGAGLVATSIKFGDASIQVRNRIRLVTQDIQEINAVNEELFRQSRDARVALTAQAELYQRIGLSAKQLGANTQEVLAATEATAKAITLSASSAQAANATIIQFGQALAFGKLRGDELRSVLEQSPRLAQALADGLGIARGELIGFGFAGKLASDRVFRALLSQLPKLREEFKLIVPRIGEAGNVLVNSFIKAGGAINDVIPIATGFAQSILDLADAVDKSIPGTINKLLQLRLAWINFKSLLDKGLVQPTAQFGRDFQNAFRPLKLLSDQSVESGIRGIADALRKPNFTELNDIADGFDSAAEGLLKWVSAQGRWNALKDPAIQNIIGTLGPDPARVYDDAIKAVQRLNELTVERIRLQQLVQARDAARAAQKVDTLPLEAPDGTDLTGNIKLEFDASDALRDLEKLAPQIRELTADVARFEVIVDFKAAEQRLIEYQEEVAKFEDQDDPLYAKALERKNLYAELLKAVKAEGTALQNLVDEKKLPQEALDAYIASLAAFQRNFPALLELPDYRAGTSKESLIQQRDPAADTRIINAFIEKQKALIIELTTVEGIERDLATLRLKAGEKAVSLAEDQIRANQRLIDAQQPVADALTEAEKINESLQKRIDKTDELTAAEQIRANIAGLRIRTDEEEKAVQDLQEYLVTQQEIAESVGKNIILEKQLALSRLLSGTISQADYDRNQLLAEEADKKERIISANKVRLDQEKEIDRIISRRVEEGDTSTPAAERMTVLIQLHEDLAVAQQRVIDLSDKTGKGDAERIQKLEKAREAVQLFEQDIVRAGQLFQDFTIDAVEAVREAAEQMNAAMSDFFFDAMQGNFDNLLQNLVNSFKAAIDRMVADALAAALMEKLVGNGGFIGDFLSVLMGVGGAAVSGGGVGGSGGGGGGIRLGGAAKGGFQAPGKFMEVNELGQEALILGAKNFLIPTGDQVSRITPPALMGQVRGLESGGFARPSEMVQVNERGLEALRMGDVTKILGGITSSEGGAVRSVAGGLSASKGSLSKTILGGATLVSFPGSFPPPSSGQESLPRGGTAQFYTDDAARRLQQSIPDSSSTLPKIYNMGGRTFMRMGSSGGFVIPHDKTNEIIQKETMGKIPGREFGGSVQSRSVYEVNEGILPELLSIGSRDFLLTGGSSGYVTPTNSASELGMNQNINVTIVTPDVDGFRKTQSQIQNELGRAANLANRRNG